MGQYYNPMSIDKKQWLYSHDYDQGLKLMEHSYIGNILVELVEQLLSPSGDWHKTSFVWAGDYADGEDKTKEESNNLYTLIGTDENKIKPSKTDKNHFRYVINHTKKLFVDTDKIKDIPNDKGWKIHPLPLLTCEGNGRGGGDFHGEDDRIGTWARDIISVDDNKPKDYEEMDGQFIEER